MKQKEIILPGLILLFIASFFFSFAVASNVILMCLLVVVILASNTSHKKLQLLKERKYLWLMLAFAIYIFISFLFSDNRADGMRSLRVRIPLLVFPFSLGLLEMTKEKRNKILLGFAVIVSVACLACLVYSINRYYQTKNSAFLYNDALSHLVGQQSIYTSVFVNLSIYIFTWHLLFSSHNQNRKILLVIGIGFLFVVSYLLASRNMMVMLYFTAIIFSFSYTLRRKKYLEGATLLMGMLIAGFLVFKFFPKTINRFKELTYTKFDYQSKGKESHYADTLAADQWNGANFRLAAWPCGWQLFKEHPVVGVGLGDKKDELLKVYEQKHFLFGITTKKNVHNNYLDILYSMGIIGLLLFLIAWIILPFFRITKNKDWLALLSLVTFIVAMLSENYFDRSYGTMLFTFFILFLLTSSKQKPIFN